MIANRLISFLADPDVAIDLGTANTRIYVLDRGVVADQPTRVPSDAAASHADDIRDRGFAAPGPEPVAPLRGGVVYDVTAAARLIAELLRPARRLGLISRGRSCARPRTSMPRRAPI